MVELLSDPTTLQSGNINIWLSQPFTNAGEVVSGSVMLDMGQVPADSLTLYLKGVDELTIWKRHLKKNRRYLKSETTQTQFARIKLLLTNFADRKTPAGKTAYPFQIALPDDLPPTNVAKSEQIRGLRAATRYILTAEVVGAGQKYTQEQELLVCRPKQNSEQSINALLSQKVGGFFGLAMQSFRAEFQVENNVYSPGDQIHVIVNVDNSQCAHKVGSVKFKIWRQITYNLDGKQVTTGEYLSQVKIDGCKSRSALRQEYQIPIDIMESDGKTLIAGTCNQKDYSVTYYLRCFVKHAAIFEVGQGNCVQVPIHIIHKPDERLTEEPYDREFTVNCKTAEFDAKRNAGDCVFETKKDKFSWHITERPLQLTFLQVKNDHDLSRVKYTDKVINDFESVPLPLVGQEGIVCLGFEQVDSPWPDFKEVFNPDWRSMMEYKDAAHWENADFDLLPPAKQSQAVKANQQQATQAKENQKPFDDFDSQSQQESNFDKFDALDNSF